MDKNSSSWFDNNILFTGALLGGKRASGSSKGNRTPPPMDICTWWWWWQIKSRMFTIVCNLTLLLSPSELAPLHCRLFYRLLDRLPVILPCTGTVRNCVPVWRLYVVSVITGHWDVQLKSLSDEHSAGPGLYAALRFYRQVSRYPSHTRVAPLFRISFQEKKNVMT